MLANTFTEHWLLMLIIAVVVVGIFFTGGVNINIFFRR